MMQTCLKGIFQVHYAKLDAIMSLLFLKKKKKTKIWVTVLQTVLGN